MDAKSLALPYASFESIEMEVAQETHVRNLKSEGI